MWRAAILLLAVGCARLPAGGAVGGSKRLIFKFTIQGQINPNYVYIVALRPSKEVNPSTQGPIPVIAPPWGNGFVAGNATHFVRWDPVQNPDYLLYAFRDAALLNYFALGVPINYVDPVAGGKTLQFELDLTQIAPTATDEYQSLQVNFLTMNRVPSGNSGTKQWDALGDSNVAGQINDYITIPLRTSGVYDNNRFAGLEPSNDAPDPDLDIVDFSVEVRLQ